MRDISGQIRKITQLLDNLDIYDRRKLLIINGIFGVIAVATIACCIAAVVLMSSHPAGSVLFLAVLTSAFFTPISYFAFRALFISGINYANYKNIINKPDFRHFINDENVEINVNPFNFENFQRIVHSYQLSYLRKNVETPAQDPSYRDEADKRLAEAHKRLVESKKILENANKAHRDAIERRERQEKQLNIPPKF